MLNLFIQVALFVTVQVLKNLPRAELAGVARRALALLATRVEAKAPNPIVHEAEEVAFTELDGLLAKIQGQ